MPVNTPTDRITGMSAAWPATPSGRPSASPKAKAPSKPAVDHSSASAAIALWPIEYGCDWVRRCRILLAVFPITPRFRLGSEIKRCERRTS